MAVKFASATLTAAGAPQNVATSLSPAAPTVSAGGVTFPAGSTSEKFRQITFFADTANTGNVYIGSAGMVKATRAGVGGLLVPGAALTLGGYGSLVDLDGIYFDGDTNGNKLLGTFVG